MDAYAIESGANQLLWRYELDIFNNKKINKKIIKLILFKINEIIGERGAYKKWSFTAPKTSQIGNRAGSSFIFTISEKSNLKKNCKNDLKNVENF